MYNASEGVLERMEAGRPSRAHARYLIARQAGGRTTDIKVAARAPRRQRPSSAGSFTPFRRPKVILPRYEVRSGEWRAGGPKEEGGGRRCLEKVAQCPRSECRIPPLRSSCPPDGNMRTPSSGSRRISVALLLRKSEHIPFEPV